MTRLPAVGYTTDPTDPQSTGVLGHEIKYKNQAEAILARFGGPMNLYRIIKEIEPENAWSHTSIYRWKYPRSKGGTGGVIPSSAFKLLWKAARFHGIILTVEDMFPQAFD